MAPVTRFAGVLFALLLFPAFALAQSSATPNGSSPQQSALQLARASAAGSDPANDAPPQSQESRATAKPEANPARKKKKKKLPQAPRPESSTSEAQQTSRLLWIVPNFAAVSPGVKFERMTPKQKFWMATEDSFDYSSFVWTGVLAAQDYALDTIRSWATALPDMADITGVVFSTTYPIRTSVKPSCRCSRARIHGTLPSATADSFRGSDMRFRAWWSRTRIRDGLHSISRRSVEISLPRRFRRPITLRKSEAW